MPESRAERVIFVLGLVLILGLGFDIVRESRRPSAASGTPAPANVAVAAAAVTGSTATHAAVTAPARTTEQATGATPSTVAKATPSTVAKARASTVATAKVSLVLTAARGDTWMEIRAGSATGTVLYTGTLPADATRTFRSARIWASFGGAGRVDARLNGKPLRLPFGTYDAVFDSSGFRQVPSGKP